jgi:hypothetical protein
MGDAAVMPSDGTVSFYGEVMCAYVWCISGADPESLDSGNSWRVRSASLTWGSGAMPPVASRDKAPGQGVRGRSAPEADEI